MAAESVDVDDLSEPKHEIVGYDDLCSCCLAAGALVNMLQKIEHGGKMENYYDLIRKCYDSQLLSLDSPSNKYYICHVCIARLTDSYSFKLQIIEAQKTLQDFFKVQETTQGLTSRKRSDSSTKLSDYLAVTQAVLKTESSDSDDDGDPFGDDADLSDYKPPPSPPTSKSTKRAKSKENTPQRPKPIQIIIPTSQPTKSKRTSVTRASPLKPLATKQPAKQPVKQATKRPASSSAKQPAAKQSKTSTSKPPPRAPQTKAETRRTWGSVKAQNEKVRSAMDLEKMQCLVCTKVFRNRPTLANHMNVHFINYTCDKCGKGFATDDRYKNHRARHVVGSFPCGECGKVFETRDKLYNHRASHFSRNKCKYCPETFKSFLKKNKHMRDVHGEPNAYACTQCDQTFIIGYALAKHVRRHHSVRIRKHSCEECDKEFFDSGTLRLHAVVHTKIDKFPCTICPKRFKRKKNLTQHLKIHLDIRDFQCAHCGQEFVQKCSLQYHIRKHSEEIKF